MPDSVNNPEQQETKTPAVSEEIMLRRDTKVKVVRGEGGKFQKQRKSLPKTADITRLLRNLLNAPVMEADEYGKLTVRGAARIRKMFDNIFTIASNDPNQPVLDKFGNPVYVDGKLLTTFDAKAAMASVQAFKELMLRAYGMPSKSDEEIEAMKKEGVKIVILQHPELMDKTVVEDKPRERLVPTFAEVLEITENSK